MKIIRSDTVDSEESSTIKKAKVEEEGHLNGDPPLDSTKPPVTKEALDPCIPKLQDLISPTHIPSLGMVDIQQNPAIEEAVAEEILKSQSESLNHPPDPRLSELEDLPSSFPEFESVRNMFREGNTELSDDSNIADSGGNPVDHGSVKGDSGASKESSEVSGEGISEKDEVQKELGEKEGSSLDSEVVGSDGDGDGSNRKLEDLGNSTEEQLGKVSTDGASSNCLVPVVAPQNDETSGATGMLDGSSERIDTTNDEVDVVGAKEIGTKIDGTASKEDESGEKVMLDGSGVRIDTTDDEVDVVGVKEIGTKMDGTASKEDESCSSGEKVMLDGSDVRIDTTDDEVDVVGVQEIETKIDGTASKEDDEESGSESSFSSISSSSSQLQD